MRAGDRVRSEMDGQLGFLVEEEDGRWQVLLDRPQEKRKVPYHENDWKPDPGVKLTPLQIARVVHDADRALRFGLGLTAYSIKDWLQLRDQERIRFINGVPEDAEGIRQRLAAAIKGVLEGP